MDISTDNHEFEENHRPDPFLTFERSIQDLIRKLTGIFKVTDEDMSDAGIYHGDEGRD
ncbi:MAG: hypothetical protein ABSA01_14295 [Anaerolineales bacterium]|jgi:hypothetical protein